MRALAIVSVVLFHIGLPAAWELTRYGWAGVDLFFVLSGFLIGSQLFREMAVSGRRIRLGRFYARRAFRILPAFLLTVAVYALLPSWRESANLPPVWRFLTFTQNFGLQRSETGAFTHAWSLCVEEHFYIAFPLLALVMRNWRARSVGAVLVSSIAAALMVRALLWLLVLPPYAETRAWYSESAAWMYYPTFAHFDGLVLGVALACVRIFRPRWWTRLREAPVKALAVAAACMAVVVTWGDLTRPFGATTSFMLASCAGAALIVAASSEKGERVCSFLPLARLLALLAYPIYLTHKLVLHAFKTWAQVNGLEPYGAPMVLPTLLGCLMVGAALHVVVERPMLRVRDRMTNAPGS